MIDILNRLFSAPSVSGREKPITDLIAKMLEGHADSIRTDAMGNLIAFKKGGSDNAKKIMLGAHCDEIGFIVTFIEEKGQLRIAPIGGIDWAAAAYSEVTFDDGLKGVIVPEDRVKASDYRADKFYIDIGASSREEAEKLVCVGSTAALTPSLTKLCGKRYAGRPVDDKIACAILVKLMKELQNCNNDIYAVFTVQEEVGCRGARPASYALKPDYAIALDVTGTGDELGSAPMAVKVGAGAAIKIKDSSVICDIGLVNKMKDTAKSNGIDYQLEILTGGGTDTSSMQMAGTGAVTGAISIPTRYIHTGVELFDEGDADCCLKLAEALCYEL